jgi:ATP-dependent DNA helicase RecQ
MIEPEMNYQHIKSSLKQIWGYDDFRPPQAEIIQALLAGQDCLIVMPTGGGKSLCFQLPALLQQGLTVVVSPLVVLMENQVQELRAKKLPVAILHSEIAQAERRKTLAGLREQQFKLLYLSPETLLSKPIWEIIASPDTLINSLIIDEAHCLSQWGDTFRPAYRRLGTIRPSLSYSNEFTGQKSSRKSSFPIACFTATADQETQQVITESLKLVNPVKFLLSPYRPNLQLKVKTIWTPKGRQTQLINFLQSRRQQSGLVYVRARQKGEELAQLLTNLGYHTQVYHAGLTNNLRRKIETDWLSEKIKFVVCTSAFGMGINKSNLRWIFHYQAPLLLSEYLQEVGRGGRDGKLTEAITLISEPTGWLNPEDQQQRLFFLNQLHKKYHQAKQICRKIPQQASLDDLSKKSKNPDLPLYLSILNSSKQLEWLDPFHYQLRLNNSEQSIKLLLNKQKKLAQQTHKYLTTKTCRWRFLLSAFGFSLSHNFCCGHCDNCQLKS